MNPNTNQSNNRGIEPDDLDVSPVFDKMGNRIGIRRATNTSNALSCHIWRKRWRTTKCRYGKKQKRQPVDREREREKMT